VIVFKPKNIDWDHVQLGSKPDGVLAKELGVTPGAVKNQRWKRAIKSFNPAPRNLSHINWDSLGLGMKSDMEIGREYGIPQSVVTRHRSRLGIKSFEESRNEMIKTRWNTAGFGQYPDWRLASKFNVHISTVIKERRKRNILSYHKLNPLQPCRPKGPKPKPKQENPLKVPKIRTLRFLKPRLKKGKKLRLEVHQSNPKPKKEKTPSPESVRPIVDWSKVPLGAKPDRVIAQGLGISIDTVNTARLKLGIPSYKQKHIVTDWSKIPLGKVPDWVVAEQLGKSIDSVCVARSSRGIPPFAAICKTTEGQPCNAPEGMIDLYWHENNIPHEFQVRFGRFIADWKINGDTIVEYSGWERHPRYGYIYLERIARKIIFYENLGYKVLIITPKTLKHFKPKGIPAYTRACSRCHKAVGNFERGFCKACYKREYLRPKLKAQKEGLLRLDQNQQLRESSCNNTNVSQLTS
jgi:hypothetical protein